MIALIDQAGEPLPMRIDKWTALSGIAVLFFLMVFIPSGSTADYYVDCSLGDDFFMGTSEHMPWKTMSKINTFHFNPGDRVFFKRGEVWRDPLIISSSGDAENPLIFSAYGEGPNPIIKCTKPCSDWALVYTDNGKKIWKGSGIKIAKGAMKGGKRLPQYLGSEYTGKRLGKRQWSPPDSILDMRNGFFYAPVAERSIFYLRWDHGHPGTIEIGKQRYGIYVSEQKFINIQSIDVYGPGGGKGWSDSRQIIIEKSNHIVISDCTVSYHHNGGVIIRDGSNDCIIKDVKSFGHRSSGLYLWEAGTGNQVLDSEVYSCGTLQTDYGDMGLIGVWRSSEVKIEGCYVHDNGHSNINTIDAGISFAQSKKGRIERCLIKNTGGTAIQFAEASDNSLAAYNVIDGWGTFGSINSNEGIRIGGGMGPTARNCKVFNNLFVNGGATPGRWAALRILNQYNAGLEVKNNIFYNNLGVYEILAESKEQYKNWQFSNNFYYRTEGAAIEMAGKQYDYTNILSGLANSYPSEYIQEKDSLIGDSKVDLNAMKLLQNSPCIDAGIDVGFDRDFYGNPVPFGNGVDIGPFEYQY